MKQTYPVYYPQFFTATILEWKHLLADDKHKDIIINSLKFLVNEMEGMIEDIEKYHPIG